jgi:hypothetical protein
MSARETFLSRAIENYDLLPLWGLPRRPDVLSYEPGRSSSAYKKKPFGLVVTPSAPSRQGYDPARNGLKAYFTNICSLEIIGERSRQLSFVTSDVVWFDINEAGEPSAVTKYARLKSVCIQEKDFPHLYLAPPDSNITMRRGT